MSPFSLGEAVLDITADAKGLAKDLEGAKGEVESTLGSVGMIAGGIVAAAFAAAVATIGISVGILMKSIGAAMESEVVSSQTTALIKATGGAAGLSAKQVKDLATSLSLVTRYDDELIQSGENILLTFTNIGDKVFPRATEAALDIATTFGIDVVSATRLLGKALQDPAEGMGALERVTGKLDQATKDQIQTMMDAGDVYGAQTLLLDTLNGRIGGTAKAAGETMAGMWDIIKNKVENVFESIGTPFLKAIEGFLTQIQPLLDTIGTDLETYLSSPEAQKFFSDLADTLAYFGGQVAVWMPQIVQWFGDTLGWLMNNQGIIVAALAAIGVAVAALGVVAAVAIWGALAPLLPVIAAVIAIMAIVAGAAYLIYQAWTTNFLGIQGIVAAWWAYAQPILSGIANIIGVVITFAVQTLANYWTNILHPALLAVWSWMSTVAFPFWQSVANLLSAVVGKAVEALAGLWQNVLYPAIEKVWSYVAAYFSPGLKLLADIFNNVLGPAIKWVSDNVLSRLAGVFDGIADAVQRVTGWISGLADKIRNLSLPSWLTPGSPTPFEMGLRGIGSALEDIATSQLPSFSYGLSAPSLAGAGAGSSESYFPDANFNLGAGAPADAYSLARQVAQIAGDMIRQQRNAGFQPGG